MDGGGWRPRLTGVEVEALQRHGAGGESDVLQHLLLQARGGAAHALRLPFGREEICPRVTTTHT